MHLWIVIFFLGVSTLFYFARLPNLFVVITVTSGIFIGFLWLKQGKKLFLYLGLFSLGFTWALIYVSWLTKWQLPPALENKPIVVTGYIASVPTVTPHRSSFTFKTITIANSEVATKLKLSWYGETPKLAAGDKWNLTVRLKRPHTTLNPGSFDREKYLLLHHLRAVGYVVKSATNHRIASRWYHYPLTRLRQQLLRELQQLLGGEQLAPIIIALLIGVTSLLTPEQWQVLRNTGTNYLIAISGLHVGLVAIMVLVGVQFLWRRAKRLPLLLPAQEAGVIAGVLGGACYAAIAGFSIPTQRALIMLVVFSIATLFRRHAHAWNGWLWSLFFVVVLDPLAGLSIGFWLSFMAVAAILYITSWRSRQQLTYFSKLWRIQVTVTLVLLPFSLLFFQQVAWIALVANLLALPGICLIVVPLCLGGGLSLLFSKAVAGWLLWLSNKVLQVIWWWLNGWAQGAGGSWYQPIYQDWLLGTTLVGVLLLLVPRGVPLKPYGLIWLAPLFFYLPPKPQPHEVWFTLLDVGQGVAAVVQTAHHLLLYDTGPKFFQYDTGASIVIPYLRLQGVNHIDAIVVSHADLDHSGGLAAIWHSFKTATIFTSAPEKFLSYRAQPCIAGQHWQWDGVEFQILSPPAGAPFKGNEASCVLKISSGSNAILLTGDIEHSAERLLKKNYGALLSSKILVAPHHGSATSSTNALIQAVLPQYVLFPVGYKNQFRFPHKRVMARYAAVGTKLLNTALTGAITFKFSNKSAILQPILYREVKRRFWHD